MIRANLSFEVAMYREARREARRLGMSFAEYCRRVLSQVLAERHRGGQKPWMRYSGTFASGEYRASRSVDEFTYRRPR